MRPPGELQSLGNLLDEALDLPESERMAWLAARTDLSDERRLQLQALLSNGAQGMTLPPLPSYTANELVDPGDGLTEDSHIGPYRLIRELGRGGMGSVWLAERTDGTLKRQVALKLPHSNLPQRQLAERFARERDILAGLEHPNIARLYDAGVTPGGRPYLAMEYVVGNTLMDYCRAGRLGLKQRLQLFQQVLRAIQYAHSHLIVHRDLKPGNILVTSSGEVRLLDFGIAKLMSDDASIHTQLTEVGSRLFTPQYAAPEQILGQAIGTSADIYSLGVLLYELLTGNLPYRLKRDTRGALEDSILEAETPPASESARNDPLATQWTRSLRGDLDTILRKALKKAPPERYATAAAFADDLNRYLNGEAVSAQPDSLGYRARKFIGRNRWSVVAATLVFLSLSGGLGAALWQAQIANQKAQEARKEAKTAKAVQEFLRGIFVANSAQQPDPFKARETTVRELLDIGFAQLDQSLDDAPEAKTDVLLMFGELYNQLLVTDKTAELAQLNTDLNRKIHGTDSIEVMEALGFQARAVRARWIDDPHQWALITECEAILDHVDPSNEKSWYRLAILGGKADYLKDRDLAGAQEAIQRALSFYRGNYDVASQLDGEAAPQLLASARVNLLAGNTAEAIALAQHGLAAAKRLNAVGKSGEGGFIHEAGLLEVIGKANWLQGDLPGAEKQLRAALAAASRSFGTEDPETAGIQVLLGAVLFYTKEASKVAEGRQLVAQATRTLGLPKPGDRSSIHYAAYANLGKGQLAADRPQEAMKTLAAALAMRDPNLDASPAIAELLRDQTCALIQLGRHADARVLLDKAIAMREKSGVLNQYALAEEAELDALLKNEPGNGRRKPALPGNKKTSPN